MKTLSLNDFGNRLVELFLRLMHEIVRYENNYVTAGKITVLQLLVLEHLSHCEKCKMNELAKSMETSFSTTTGMVDRLVKQDLAARHHGQVDRRTVLVSITTKGETILREVYSQKRKGILQLFGRLSSKERSAYLDIIEKLVENLSSAKQDGGTVNHEA